MPAKDPSDRSLIASIAADISWSRTANRAARTEAARRALQDRFVQLVPDEITDPADRARAAENLRRAYYKLLALRSAQSRRAKAAKKRTPRSCRDGSGPLCTPEDRCSAHRIDVDPPTVGDVLAGGGA